MKRERWGARTKLRRHEQFFPRKLNPTARAHALLESQLGKQAAAPRVGLEANRKQSRDAAFWRAMQKVLDQAPADASCDTPAQSETRRCKRARKQTRANSATSCQVTVLKISELTANIRRSDKHRYFSGGRVAFAILIAVSKRLQRIMQQKRAPNIQVFRFLQIKFECQWISP